ncbi:hypothetical protein ONZ45_g15469 [Pleurotus djamor]|nr:hypothetical protein ONZ45_g15469 [Pleurotus djamor]
MAPSTRSNGPADNGEGSSSTPQPTPQPLASDITNPSVREYTIKNDMWPTDQHLDLRRNNWESWSKRVTLALNMAIPPAKRYLDNSQRVPDLILEPRAHENYLNNDTTIASFIKFNCSEVEQNFLAKHRKEKASDVWTALKERHTNRGTLHRVLLQDKLMGMRFSTEPGADIEQEWYDIKEVHRQICEMGPMSNLDFLMVAAMSASRGVPAIRDFIVNGVNNPGVPFGEEELDKRIRMHKQLEQENVAFYTNTKMSATSEHKAPSSQRRKCKNCGLNNHSVEFCKRKRSDDTAAVATTIPTAPPPPPSTNPSILKHGGNEYLLDPNTRQAFLLHENNGPLPLANPNQFAGIAHMQEYSAWLLTTDSLRTSCDWNTYSLKQQATTHIAAFVPDFTQRRRPVDTSHLPFYLDSGASTHISPERGDFFELYPIPPRRVQGVGGSAIFATGIGKIKLLLGRGCSITLDNVLFIPNSTVRLLSISALILSLRCRVTFEGSCVSLYGSSGALLASGCLTERNLYKLNCSSARTEHSAFYSAPATPETWHYRLGHAHHEAVREMVDGNLAEGMPSSLPCNISKCEFCIRAKQTHEAIPREREHGRAKRRLDTVWVDLTGPEDVASAQGNLYLMHIIDDFSRYSWTVPLKHKSDALPKLQIWHAITSREVGYSVGLFRTDNGELKSKAMDDFCDSIGARHDYSAPYTSAHIGSVERHHRAVMEKGRAMRLQCNLPPNRWEEFCMTACYLIRRTYTSATKMTPYKAWFGRKPNLSHLREIGCRAFVLIQDRHNPKIYARSIECILVGYSHTAKAYRCYDPTGRRILESYNVRFIERKDALSVTAPTEPASLPTPSPNPSRSTSPSPIRTPSRSSPLPIRRSSRLPQLTEKAADAKDMSWESKLKKTIAGMKKKRSDENKAERAFLAEVQSYINDPMSLFAQDTQASLAERHSTHILDSIHPDEAASLPAVESAFSLLSDSEADELLAPDPTYEEARRSKDWPKWEGAIVDEKGSLVENEVFEYVRREDVPKGRTVLKGKLVLHRKRNERGEVVRYKARYVAKGFQQVFGKDYHDTTSPTARPESIRSLLHIAAANDWDIQQIDVKTAFLYGQLPEDEQIYIEQIKDFDDPDHPAKDWVWLLRRGLYGLKQAGRVWNKTMNGNMTEWGCERLPSDACVYYRKNDQGRVAAAVHVDDFMAIGDKKEATEALKDDMKKVWTISELGDINFCLGISIRRDRPRRTIHLSQTALIEKLASVAEVPLNSAPATTPMSARIKLARPSVDEKISASDAMKLTRLPYRQVVGILLYIACMTRPDVAYTASRLAQYLDCYRLDHWNAAVQAVRYLISTRYMELTLGGRDPIDLRGFSDSSWADCIDTRRSNMGYCFTLGSGVISWCAKKQKLVTCSTTDAEYVAMNEACREGVWLRHLLGGIDYGPVGPTRILGDNNGALALSKDAVYHSRSKHIDVRYHYIQEQVDDDVIVVERVNTKDNLADMFTKPLDKGPFETFRRQLGVL